MAFVTDKGRFRAELTGVEVAGSRPNVQRCATQRLAKMQKPRPKLPPKGGISMEEGLAKYRLASRVWLCLAMG